MFIILNIVRVISNKKADEVQSCWSQVLGQGHEGLFRTRGGSGTTSLFSFHINFISIMYYQPQTAAPKKRNGLTELVAKRMVRKKMLKLAVNGKFHAEHFGYIGIPIILAAAGLKEALWLITSLGGVAAWRILSTPQTGAYY
jgi:hypothetical protein